MRSDRIPSDDEQDACDGGVGHGFADGRNDGVIGNTDAVCRGVAHAGHEAAFDRAVQKRLLAGVFAVGQLPFAVAKGNLETELVAVDLFVGKGGLVTERSQRPALCGFDGNAVDLDRAEAVVDDI